MCGNDPVRSTTSQVLMSQKNHPGEPVRKRDTTDVSEIRSLGRLPWATGESHGYLSRSGVAREPRGGQWRRPPCLKQPLTQTLTVRFPDDHTLTWPGPRLLPPRPLPTPSRRPGETLQGGGGELNIGHFKDEDTKAARMFPDTLLQGAGLGEASVPQRCPRAPPSSVTAGVLLGFWNNFSYC